MKMFIAPLVVLSLILCSACSLSNADTITTDLSLAVDAAIAAAPAIEAAANVSPATATVVTAALNSAETCLTAAQTILNGAQTTTAQESVAIVAACTSASAITIFPAGTPIKIVSIVNAMSNAVATFLNSLPKSVSLVLQHPEYAQSFAGKAPKPSKLNQKKLKEVRTKLGQLHAKLHPARK